MSQSKKTKAKEGASRPRAASTRADEPRGLEEAVSALEELGQTYAERDDAALAGRLLDRRYRTVQRQSLAGEIGRLQGNRHLNRLLNGSSKAPTPPGEKSGARALRRRTPAGGRRDVPVENARQVDEAANGRHSGAAVWLFGVAIPMQEKGTGGPPAVDGARTPGVRTRPGLETGLQAPAVTPLGTTAAAGRIRRSTTGTQVQRQGGGGTPEPIPKLTDAKARGALALDVLKKAYGGLIKKESKVNGLDNESKLRSEYDAAMARQGRVFKETDGTTRPWAAGDSSKHPAVTGDFPGFYDPSTGSVYIDLSRPPDEQVATVAHELLHANAAGDFESTLGRNVDEGMTESLTIKAFSKAGYGAASGFFGGQVAMVGKLSAMFGENTMMMAYFHGASILRSMMDATLEEGTFERFAIEVRANNSGWLDAFFNRWREAMGGSELDKKIAAINGLLDWWVSDADLESIQNIWHGSTEDEKRQIRYAIQPRVSDLTDHGQRARLRAILGS